MSYMYAMIAEYLWVELCIVDRIAEHYMFAFLQLLILSVITYQQHQPVLFIHMCSVKGICLLLLTDQVAKTCKTMSRSMLKVSYISIH